MAVIKGVQPGKKGSWRILLVDDHPLVREGLANIFHREADLEVCGQAEERHAALQLVEATHPDLVVTDLTLKNSHGLELIKDLHTRHPHVLILVVSMHDEQVNAERAIRAGASGYITKEEATTTIVEAVRQVLQGGIYLSQKISAQMISKLAGRPHPEQASALEGLTDRELQIFELLGDGIGRRQIAERLHLDINTVETYRARIREKLKLKDALELLQYAIQSKRENGQTH